MVATIVEYHRSLVDYHRTACEVVKSSGCAAISFDMIVYPFVRDYLASCAAEHDLDYLVRDLALSSSRPEFAHAACRWDWSLPAPISMDLRPRIVRAVERGSSIREAARRFAVSPSAAIKLMQRVRATGSAAPAR